MSDLLVTDAQDLNGNRIDIQIVDGRIESTAERGALSGTVDSEYDVGGNLVTPTFAEPHMHLDITLTAGDPRWNRSGTLSECFDIWDEYAKTLTADDVRERAEQAIKWLVANGATRIRTHVDVTEETHIALDVLLELREEFAHLVDLQVVAMPTAGILTQDHHEDLLEEALAAGADLVGGIPHYENTYLDGVKSVKILMDLAEQYECGVDVHIDEMDDPDSRFTEVLASEALKRDIGERVTASHVTAMHSYPNDYANQVINLLAESGTSVITNPLANSVLQGWFDDYPRRRGYTRIEELQDAGVTVGIGHDSIMDMCYHYGTGDPLDAAYVLVHFAHMHAYDDVRTIWNMMTDANASIFGVDAYGLRPDDEGSLIVFDGETPFDVLRRRAPRSLVVKEGNIIARTEPATTTLTGADETEQIQFQMD